MNKLTPLVIVVCGCAVLALMLGGHFFAGTDQAHDHSKHPHAGQEVVETKNHDHDHHH